MEIQKSLIVHTSQSKKQTYKTESFPEPLEKNSQESIQSIENLSNSKQYSIPADFIPATTKLSLKQSVTKTVLSSPTINTTAEHSYNTQTIRALVAYNTELNQFSKDKAANLISGIDYFV